MAVTALALLAGTAAPACVLVFGQGRNYDPDQPERNQYWDTANGRFNLAVREPLVAAGQDVANMVLPVAATDVPANLKRLMAEVKRLGCTRVLETALFADPAAGVVIARLRLYPVMGIAGPQAAGSHPRIGAVAYTLQREFPLRGSALDRVDSELLGRAMAAEALPMLAPSSDARGVVSAPSAAPAR
ncbi:hypothetical protein [Roseateles sp. YR242]|uniref:hypothetical protein n=1 Tax=Roseateles sp. YR242 TaxID=1855305 RepID=UPI0011601900|nr:hypothetical protein [Roseateles sp. YR242]